MYNVDYNIKEQNKIIIENTLKMLKRRNIIESIDDIIDKIKDYNNQIYEFEESNNIFSVNIIHAKISSISQGSTIDDYLLNNINIHKIIIIKEITKKVIKDIASSYKNVELFLVNELLEDKPSNIFMSEHQLLGQEQKIELLNTFSEKDLSTILVTDMMSRYYNAKVGDIFRIIRPSITSGKNICYRRVIMGSWDILFS
jgi:DNA-directed RNA polymerase I, II, and III subunit RPABC1